MKNQLSFGTSQMTVWLVPQRAPTTSSWAIHSGDYEIWTAANWDSSGTPALLTEIYIQFWSICHGSCRARHARIGNHLNVLKLDKAGKSSVSLPQWIYCTCIVSFSYIQIILHKTTIFLQDDACFPFTSINSICSHRYFYQCFPS